MKVRWRLEPNLALVNGGASTLWHGTSKADPWDIYAAEFGGSLSQPWSQTQSHVSLTVTASLQQFVWCSIVERLEH